MKRNLSCINEDVINDLIDWVHLDDKGSECIHNCDICKNIFPKLPRIDDNTLFKCPCPAYGVRYVTKVVKQVIKDWEAENEE